MFKLLRSPRIYSKEPIPPGCVAWLAGQYDNPIPTRFLAPIDCLKIPAHLLLVTNLIIIFEDTEYTDCQAFSQVVPPLVPRGDTLDSGEGAGDLSTFEDVHTFLPLTQQPPLPPLLIQTTNGANHRVDRVLRFFSIRPNWDSQPPVPQA
jgi:hypothetical protein